MEWSADAMPETGADPSVTLFARQMLAGPMVDAFARKFQLALRSAPTRTA